MSETTVSSHLLVLRKLLQDARIYSSMVLEFGMGRYSTPLFVKLCRHTTSIEMQHQAWYDITLDLISPKSSEKWTPLLMLGPTAAIEWLDECRQTPWMLAFVDGHGASRWRVVNKLIEKRVPRIVMHDTQEPSYRWDRIELADYRRLDFKKGRPWTSLLTTDDRTYRTMERSGL